MSGIDFTVLSNVLEKDILPAVKHQMYERAPLWQLFGGWAAEDENYLPMRANVGVDHFENNTMYVSTRNSYNSGIVSIGISEKYQYGNPTYQQGNITIKTLVGSFTMPKQVLNTTDRGAIIKPLTGSSKALANDLAMDANRQLYGDGSGAIATSVSSGSSATTVALQPYPSSEVSNGDIDYARYFPPNVYIKIGSSAVVQVSNQTGSNQITLLSGATFNANDSLIKQTGSNTNSSEMTGLMAMVDDVAGGTYMGINPATVYTWASSEDDTTETITNANIFSKMNKQFFKANKVGRVTWIIMNSSLFQTYGNSLTGQIRFNQKEVLAGGWIGLDYMAGNAQILLDYDCTDDRIYFLTVEDIVFGEYQSLEWEHGTDGILYKIQQQIDYEVTASRMGEVGTVSRASHALMQNKTAGF